MNEAPPPEMENKLIFEHKIKFHEKDYILKMNNLNSGMNLIINELNSISNNYYLNSFSFHQLQAINNYFKMFDIINEAIINLNKLFEENKFKILEKDKSFIVKFFPGILIKGEIQFILYLKEKSDKEKINDLSLLTHSILKRIDNLEKENLDLKTKIKELIKENFDLKIKVKDFTKELNEYKTKNNNNVFFKDSVILTSEQDREKMLNLLNKKIMNVELLYRGTRDGDNAKNFHEKCDNKGPTITLCKEKNGIIFGGYTETAWDSRKDHVKSDRNAFIFSITYNKKFNTKNTKESIFCHPNFGPVFGVGGDLTIWNNFLSSKYNNMSSNQQTFFDTNFEIVNGKREFYLNELEVFLVNLKH